MNDLYWRYAGFLIGCMGARFGLAYVAACMATPLLLKWMSAAAILVAISWIVLYVKGWRTTGAEVGGTKIWWMSLRPLHAALYLGFAASVWMEQYRCAWVWLMADALIGLIAFFLHHWRGQQYDMPGTLTPS